MTEQEIQDWLSKKIDAEITKAIFGGWPPGYDPNPTTLVMGPQPRCCYGTVLHAPNCPTWGVVT